MEVPDSPSTRPGEAPQGPHDTPDDPRGPSGPQRDPGCPRPTSLPTGCPFRIVVGQPACLTYAPLPFLGSFGAVDWRRGVDLGLAWPAVRHTGAGNPLWGGALEVDPVGFCIFPDRLQNRSPHTRWLAPRLSFLLVRGGEGTPRRSGCPRSGNQ